MICGASYGALGDATLDGEVPIREIRRQAGFGEIEEGRLLQEIPVERRRVSDGRPDAGDL